MTKDAAGTLFFILLQYYIFINEENYMTIHNYRAMENKKRAEGTVLLVCDITPKGFNNSNRGLQPSVIAKRFRSIAEEEQGHSN